MKIEKKQIAFLKDMVKEMPFFEIKKPLSELIREEPRFLSDYLSMIYRRRPLGYYLNELVKDFSFFKTRFHCNEDLYTLHTVEKKSEKIYKKYFPKDKQQNYLLDLMRRLDASKCCPLYEECNGLPDANCGVGGCDGLVWCRVYNLGGSHGFIGMSDLEAKGYKLVINVPDDLRLSKMRDLYSDYINKIKSKK